jgi:uncharacterized membrane protein YdbT with pleckstrin-like domain
MRLIPTTDTVPASVSRYLLPHERQVISVHQHPAVLIGRIFLVLAGFVIASWLSISLADDNGTALLIIWVLWGLLLAWLAVKVVDWSVNYFVVTSQRLLLAEGFIAGRDEQARVRKEPACCARRPGIRRPARDSAT